MLISNFSTSHWPECETSDDDVRLLSQLLCDLQCTICVVLIAEHFLRQAALKNYKEDVMNCV